MAENIAVFMKKIISIVSIIIMNLCLSSFTYADENSLYAKLSAGVNCLQTESKQGIKPSFHPGYIVSGAAGYQWCYGLNVEAEYAFRRNSMRKIHYFGQDFKIPGSFQSSSYMANLLWDFSPCNCFFESFQPFLGGGIGYDVQEFHATQDGFRTNQNKKGFAWQLMAGLNYPLFSCIGIALEYKFHKGPLNNIFSHAFGVSFTYKFGCDCYKEDMQ